MGDSSTRQAGSPKSVKSASETGAPTSSPTRPTAPSPAQAGSSPANAEGDPADAAAENLPLEANEENNVSLIECGIFLH